MKLFNEDIYWNLVFFPIAKKSDKSGREIYLLTERNPDPLREWWCHLVRRKSRKRIRERRKYIFSTRKYHFFWRSKSQKNWITRRKSNICHIPGSRILKYVFFFGNIIVSHFMNNHVQVFNMSKVPFSSNNFQFQIRKQRCAICISHPNCEQNWYLLKNLPSKRIYSRVLRKTKLPPTFYQCWQQVDGEVGPWFVFLLGTCFVCLSFHVLYF